MTRDFETPTGQVRLEPGDVVQLDGGTVVVLMVNGSGARVRSMANKTVKIRTRFDKEAEFVQPNRAFTISKHIERSLVVGKATEQQMKGKTT
jgi:hypothetical protein